MEVKNRVFIDSNFFIALFNPEDSLYLEAIEIAKMIDKENISLIISSLVFLEIVTVLSQRRGKEIALQVGEYFLKSQKITIVHINKELQRKSWSIFKEVKNKNISFVDVSNIAVMKKEGIKNILTFDKDLKNLGREYHISIYNQRL